METVLERQPYLLGDGFTLDDASAYGQLSMNLVDGRAAKNRGQTTFNEAAFDRGEALYEGTLMGHPFKSVAKSFQVPVWRDLCQSWQALGAEQREALRTLCPQLTDDAFSCAAA